MTPGETNETQLPPSPPITASHEPAQKLTLKDRVERNPFLYIISCVVAAIGVSGGIQQYFYSQQTAEYQRKTDELNVRLASIRRGLPGSEYLDVRKLVYAKGSSSTEIPAGSTYFTDGSFYASTAKDWQTSVSSEAQLFEDLTGISLQNSAMGKAAQIAPIHLWKPRAHSVPIENGPFKNIYPYVMLQVISFDQLHQVLRLVGKDQSTGKDVGEKKAAEVDSNKDDTAGNLEKYIRNDAVGSLFAMKLSLFVQAMGASAKNSATLVDVEEVKNVLYSQFLLTSHNLTVGGKHYDTYYFRQELILIGTPNGVSLIQTLIPSEDPAFRNSASTAVTTWLEDFRAVVG